MDIKLFIFMYYPQTFLKPTKQTQVLRCEYLKTKWERFSFLIKLLVVTSNYFQFDFLSLINDQLMIFFLFFAWNMYWKKRMDREFSDYKKIGMHLNQFMGSSSSIGAKRVRNVCVAFRAASEQNNRVGYFFIPLFFVTFHVKLFKFLLFITARLSKKG